jgi:hypothetical protein
VSSIIREIGSIPKNAFGESLAFGVGFALGAALDPAATAIRQEAWKIDPLRAPDAGTLAEGVAQRQVDEAQAKEWAAEHGIGSEAFEALVGIASTGPALGLAFAAWRRDELTDAQFATALRRTGLEEQWDAAIMALKEERLDPGAIATAIHRGIIAGEGLIVREPPRTAGEIPQVPRSPIDGTAEAASHGIDAERLRVLVGNTGLPPALGEMLQLLNRGKVTEDDVRRAVAQSNLRNEYMDAVLELRHQLPTARDFLENALRGYRTLEEALAGAELHGMSAEYATMIYQNQGRPMALRQITQALARGGKFKPEPGEIEDPYRAAIVEGNLKPAYYDLAYANRYTLPGTFALRSLAQSGDLSKAEVEQLLLESGWPPPLAKKVAARWAAGSGGGGKQETVTQLADEYEGGFITEAEFRAQLLEHGYDGAEQDLLVHLADARRAKKYREKIIDAIAAAYIAHKIDPTTATAELAEVGLSGDPVAKLLHLWDLERRARVALLTPTQIKKAYTKGIITKDAALEELEDRGYTPEDAGILLAE